jgi:hypothetical protein
MISLPDQWTMPGRAKAQVTEVRAVMQSTFQNQRKSPGSFSRPLTLTPKAKSSLLIIGEDFASSLLIFCHPQIKTFVVFIPSAPAPLKFFSKW